MNGFSNTGRVTHVRNCTRVVAWDDIRQSHLYLSNADLVFRGNEIIYVGTSYEGLADRVIDGRGKMLVPGFVNIHSHPGFEPGWKGMLEELGSPNLGQSSLYEFMPVFNIDNRYARSACRVAVHELLKSGVTTICDYAAPRENWAQDYEEIGIRTVLWASFRSGGWRTRDGNSVEYDLDPARGDRAMAEAIAAADAANAYPCDRISGLFGPAQIDTCTKEQIQGAVLAARERSQPMQIHAAQSVVEFQEIIRRTGFTPIGWLEEIGALGPETVIGHGIFLNDHPWLHFPHANDFNLLRDSGAQIAHCPVVFARRGIALNSLGRYRSAGIRIGLGTDSFPHNMLDEMRMACYAGRIIAGDFRAASTAHVFDAATIGGASILRRPDLGRLAVGCKADFSIIDLENPYMQPDYEPLRALIYSANDRAVEDVFVDGQQLVSQGKVLGFDISQDIDQLRAAQQQVLATASSRDWASREVSEMSPRVYPTRQQG